MNAAPDKVIVELKTVEAIIINHRSHRAHRDAQSSYHHFVDLKRSGSCFQGNSRLRPFVLCVLCDSAVLFRKPPVSSAARMPGLTESLSHQLAGRAPSLSYGGPRGGGSPGAGEADAGDGRPVFIGGGENAQRSMLLPG